MPEVGSLFIVPTPLGNLDDITHRAIATLKAVDWIACEDTRHTQKLLQHFLISTRTLSLHDHNEEKRTQALCQKLLAGESVALVSDAGTPLISDPGFVLVRACRQQGIPVIGLPGPCAAITALSAAGLPTDRFLFEGFLPVKSAALRSALAQLKSRTYTTVFYESPRRIVTTLQALIEQLGAEHEIVLAKEISKTFETYRYGSAVSVLDWLTLDDNHQRGEFVLMVAGTAKKDDIHISPEAEALLALLQSELPLKKAAAIVAEHYGLKKNALYERALQIKGV